MRKRKMIGFGQKSESCLWPYLLTILMLFSLLQCVSAAENWLAHEIERQSAGREWLLSGQMLREEPADCRVETRQHLLLEGAHEGSSASQIAPRRLQQLFDLFLISILSFAFRRIYLRRCEKRKLPLREETIRYIQCSDGL